MNGILYTQLMLIKILSSLVKCVNFQIFDVHVNSSIRWRIILTKAQKLIQSVSHTHFLLFIQ